jgi:8-oxo-dGTP pyrophosphatase MutT (NUDIX family)
MNIHKPTTIRNTAGAIVLRSIDEELYLLVVKRNFPGGGSDISFPKGGVNDGETIQECAIREVREETGYDIELIDYVGSYEFWVDLGETGSIRTSYTFLAELASDIQIEKEDAPEVEAVDWLPVQKALEELSYSDNKTLLQKAIDTFQR